MNQILRRSLFFLAGSVASAAPYRRSKAAEIPHPTERRILTISGKITNKNSAAVAAFDRPMLEALGTDRIETKTPWYSGTVTFEGVRMARLLEYVGATGESVIAVALNDFSSEIPVSDFRQYGVILALKRDGVYMPVRDKGPLFIIYPYDSAPELQTQKFYNRSAWQLSQMIVE